MDATQTAAKAPARPRMQIFRSEGVPLADDMMRPEPMTPADTAAFEAAAQSGMHHGHQLVCLYRSPLPDGPSLCRMWLKGGFVTPRHRHDTNCIYYVLAGELRLGNAVLAPNEGVFVPQGTVYSIEAGSAGLDVLEFRTDTVFNVEYTGNDAGFWQHVSQAMTSNSPGWPDQPRPGWPEGRAR